MPADYVTGAELNRWMQEQSDFRARLELRIATQHSEVVGTLRRIEDQVRETNGRVRDAETAITNNTDRLDRIETDDRKIETIVQTIRDDGCSQYAAHTQALSALAGTAPNTWTPQRKAAVTGGLVATGALIWPALQEIATAVHAIVGWAAGAH